MKKAQFFFDQHKQDLHCADEGFLGHFLDKEDFLKFAAKRTKTYVRLNRILGSKGERHDCPVEWEMIIPIKTDSGFKAPEFVENFHCCSSFKHYLLEGKTVLVNDKGGYNYLSPSDIILSIYTR